MVFNITNTGNSNRRSFEMFISRTDSKRVVSTRSYGITERPRDALCQLKSCQLLHSCTKSHICKGLQWRSPKVIRIAAIQWAI